MLKALFTKSRNDPSVSTRMLNIRAGKYKLGLASLRNGDISKLIGVKPYRSESYNAQIKINGKLYTKRFFIKKDSKKKALKLANEYVGSIAKLRKRKKRRLNKKI